MWARVHRWLAIVLVVLLVAWSVTGLLFHIKPGWQRAYEMLSAEQRDAPIPSTVVPLAAVQAIVGDAAVQRAELFVTALGPLYRVRTAKATVLIDAVNGTLRSPLTVDAARSLATDAVHRSTHAASYGAVAGAAIGGDTVRVRFAGGPLVEVGRNDARISQQGEDTTRIDWLYRVHYLQWTGNRSIDRVVALAGLGLIWAVMIPGVVLFIGRLRRNRPERQ